VIFSDTPLRGAFVIEPEPARDERGSFTRIFCQREFEAHGLDSRIVQGAEVYNTRAGTLRGMHYQAAPYEQVKLVRCSRGAIFDVIVDLRPESPTFTRHFAIVLSADDRRMLYIPRGFAQGYQTLEDDTDVVYQFSEFHVPEAARGVRWNDPAFGISWPPTTNRIILSRDRSYPDFHQLVKSR
jgi:dTDP-4-dehydrorhamnose 3,5-epimerase